MISAAVLASRRRTKTSKTVSIENACGKSVGVAAAARPERPAGSSPNGLVAPHQAQIHPEIRLRVNAMLGKTEISFHGIPRQRLELLLPLDAQQDFVRLRL